MVLQNKYKARASRAYNRGRGGHDSRGRARPPSARDDAAFPKLSKEDVTDDADGETDSIHAKSSPPSDGDKVGAGSQFSRRQLASNAYRYEEPEPDPYEEADPEPEVDLSAFLAKAARLHDDEAPLVGSASPNLDEEDIDETLGHLRHDNKAVSRTVLQLGRGEAEELRLLQADREKAEATWELKARFRGPPMGQSRPTRSRPSSASPSATNAPDMDDNLAFSNLPSADGASGPPKAHVLPPKASAGRGRGIPFHISARASKLPPFRALAGPGDGSRGSREDDEAFLDDML